MSEDTPEKLLENLMRDMSCAQKSVVRTLQEFLDYETALHVGERMLEGTEARTALRKKELEELDIQADAASCYEERETYDAIRAITGHLCPAGTRKDTIRDFEGDYEGDYEEGD